MTTKTLVVGVLLDCGDTCMAVTSFQRSSSGWFSCSTHNDVVKNLVSYVMPFLDRDRDVVFILIAEKRDEVKDKFILVLT